jgi:hypothetical protein
MNKAIVIPECHPERKCTDKKKLCQNCYDSFRWNNDPEYRKKNKERAVRWHKEHPERVRMSRIKRTYNLPVEQYNTRLKEQNNSCKICLKTFGDLTRYDQPYVDHDHACCPGEISCGKCIRGLICNDCNRGLGSFHDSIDILTSAIRYIKMNNSKEGLNPKGPR